MHGADHLIIVDNNSEKEVVEYLHSLDKDKVSVIFNFQNIGASAAFKQGIEYLPNICDLNKTNIVFLDDDAYISHSFKNILSIGDSGYIVPKVINEEGDVLSMNKPLLYLPVTLLDTVKYLFRRPTPSNNTGVITVEAASFVGLTMRAETAYQYMNFIPHDFFIYYDDVYFTANLTMNSIGGLYNPDLIVFHDTTDRKRSHSIIRLKYLFRNGVITHRYISRWWWIIILAKSTLYSFDIIMDKSKEKKTRIFQIYKSIYQGFKK